MREIKNKVINNKADNKIQKENLVNEKLSYDKVFWIFIIGSLLGVLIEGCFRRFEIHVNTVWGPFCLIYGIGMAGLYIGAIKMKKRNILYKFLMFTVVATIVEYLCGALLKYGLQMKAWDYGNRAFNFQKLVCLEMSIIWGLAGLAFSFLLPYLDRLLSKLKGKWWHMACLVFTGFMAVNIIVSAYCIFRWSRRHQGDTADTKIERMVDLTYNDTLMQKRFCEWRFLN